MIITPDHIRQTHSIALSIDSSVRIDNFIREAEDLWVRPALGPEMYFKIEQSVLMDNTEHPITDNLGGLILFRHLGDYELLLTGGYYDSNKKHCVGLIQAVAYLAYSRLILQNQVNVTSFGTVQKISAMSEPIDIQVVSRIARETEKIGLGYLKQCIDCLEYSKSLLCNMDRATIKKRFKVIGR